MRIERCLAVASLCLVTGCAGVATSSDAQKNNGYVEIANPAATMSPGAPATIWVPREYTESGVQRGSVLIKKGYDAVVNEIKESSQPGLTKSAPDKTAEPFRPDSYR